MATEASGQKVFYVGLCMVGRVSAGACTAGAMDGNCCQKANGQNNGIKRVLIALAGLF